MCTQNMIPSRNFRQKQRSGSKYTNFHGTQKINIINHLQRGKRARKKVRVDPSDFQRAPHEKPAENFPVNVAVLPVHDECGRVACIFDEHLCKWMMMIDDAWW